MAKDFESGTGADSHRENGMEELLGCTTGELVALHNVMTMSRGCLGGDSAKNRMLLAAADSILGDRGVTVEDGKLLQEAGS